MAGSMSHSTRSASLADVLERILDKGLVVAGDIKIKIVDIELLTIQIRLLVASVDKAREIGMDWWVNSPFLTNQGKQTPALPLPTSPTDEVAALQERIRLLEAKLAALTPPPPAVS
jgi:hypothetical protein